ncbi:MAG: 4Fe-4S binding protein, partial [Candidatus Aureabacteria bacterium]|nr:4Fe-4S binding protein [Candidatus Auribacterota bacterium]
LDTGIEGYGGPIHLAVKTSSSGELIDFKILRSNETSGYLDQLEKWKKNLLGKNIFNDTAFHGVDGISGATITSCAILNILQEAGKKMAKCLLKNTKAESAPAMQKQIDKSLFLFLFYFFLIVYLRRYPSPFLRIPVLFLTLFIWGFLLDFQYSLDHVLWLFSLDFNEFGLNRLMILSLGIPALVGLFGNVYCGSLCPFGALNELIGEIRPRSWKILDPGKNIWRWARSMKYLILFLIAIHFSLTHNRAMTSADPLTVFFIRITSFSIPMLWWLALLLSFFYRRFWCRNICPSGAFLAIFNGFHIFKKLIPPTFPGKCDLGVRNSNELDCICCDRCRYEKK